MSGVKVSEFVLFGRTFCRGDEIRVLPSVSRHRDGFVGRVLCAAVDEEGVVLYVDVFGAPGKKAPCVRSLFPVRLAVPPKRRFVSRHDRGVGDV